MPEHTSPEEKLLRLIRRKDRHPPKDDSSKEGEPSPFNISQKIFMKNDTRQKVFRILDRWLMLLTVILSAYIGYEILFSAQDVNAILKSPESTSKEDSFERIALTEPKPYTYYTAPMMDRDIFESPLYNKKTDEIKTTSSLPELTKNLRLVGIVLDKTSEAIIEDLEAKQTFFLRKGERIKDAVVDEIQESKVILLYGGQKVELIVQ